MTFQEIKNKLFYNDGTVLRDIHISDCTSGDWSNLLEFIDSKNISLITNMTGPDSQYFMLGNCKVNLFHNVWEMDIDSNEFKTIEDYHRLMDFLMELSNFLKKPILIYQEMGDPPPILTIENGHIDWL